MTDERKGGAPAPQSAPVKAEKHALGEGQGPVVVASAAAPVLAPARPENGVRVKAPAGMETISVGGLSFARDGDGFVLPASLVQAANAHIKSFVDAAEREAQKMLAELKQLEREADIPGRIKALEERLDRIEGTFGRGR